MKSKSNLWYFTSSYSAMNKVHTKCIFTFLFCLLMILFQISFLRNVNLRTANILKLFVVFFAWMSILIYSPMYVDRLTIFFSAPQGAGSWWTYPNHCLVGTYQCLFMICMFFYIFMSSEGLIMILSAVDTFLNYHSDHCSIVWRWHRN